MSETLSERMRNLHDRLKELGISQDAKTVEDAAWAIEALETDVAMLRRAEPAPETLKPCPTCGSGDVRWCSVSHRPYCGDCNQWGAVNMGTDAEAIAAWNRRAEPAAHDGDVEALVGEAIRYINEDISLHEEWAAFVEGNPEDSCSMEPMVQTAGDGEHHREWIRRLNVVLAALRTRTPQDDVEGR